MSILTDILEKLIGKPVLTKAVGSAFRHLLTALGGLLLSAGLDAEVVAKFTEAADPVVAGIAMLVVGVLLSLREKGK